MFTKTGLRYLIRDFNNRNERPFGRLMTLSRYDIVFDREYLTGVLTENGWKAENGREAEGGGKAEFSDKDAFGALGFTRVDSMDYSDYEGADYAFDLNGNALPPELAGQYDFVLDAGTIEHVFHVPHALENIFNLLKIGGTFIFSQPTFFGIGHGFYNFSHEFYYRYFEKNNWRINAYTPYMFEMGNPDAAYEVSFVSDSLLNGTLPLIGAQMRHEVFGSVTKLADSAFDGVPYQGSYDEIWGAASRIKEAVARNAGRVWLYGTGKHTKKVLGMLGKSNALPEIGLIGNGPDEIGNAFEGYAVCSVDQVRAGDTVIVSSKKFQRIIYERIRHLEDRGIKIIKLYDERGDCMNAESAVLQK
jgi:SAM-dependent methyltransferase